MDYKKAYNQLIEHAKLNQQIGYNEEHHIVPKAEGGSDDKTNLVKLTARQHYIAHLLLAKIYDDYKMYSALTYMQCKSSRNQRDFKFNSRLYEKMRVECAKKHSAWRKAHPLVGQKNGMYGRKHTEESKKKMSDNKKGQCSWLGRHHTEQSKKKISCSQKGKKLTEEHKNKIKAALALPDIKARISASISKRQKCSFWVTDGKTNHFLSKGSTIPEGFYIGRTISSNSTSSYHWYNNGYMCVLAKECPEGFVSGRLRCNQTT